MSRKRIIIIAAIVTAVVAAIILIAVFATGNKNKTGGSDAAVESGALLPAGDTDAGSGEAQQEETSPTVFDPEEEKDLPEEVSNELTGHSEHTGHTFAKEVLKKASCTEDGTVRYFCTDCDYAIEQTVKATGHTAAISPATEPTCQHTGQTEGSYCSVCKQTLKARETLPAVDHHYENGACIWCGKSQTESTGSNAQTPPPPGENELEIAWGN